MTFSLKIGASSLLFMVSTSTLALAQNVSTVVGPFAAVSEDLALDAEGNIFATDNNGGLAFPNGWTIAKISPAGQLSAFATLDGAPPGLAFDRVGNLKISNWSRNLINKITPTGMISVFATGINRPGRVGVRHFRRFGAGKPRK